METVSDFAVTTFQYFFYVYIHQRSEVGQLFALSWLITWFGHVLRNFDTIVRLYDFFLATHPLMPVYLSAAVSCLQWYNLQSLYACVLFLRYTVVRYCTCTSFQCNSIAPVYCNDDDNDCYYRIMLFWVPFPQNSLGQLRAIFKNNYGKN